MSKRVTVESGSDPRIFSADYCDKLRVLVDDEVVYDSEHQNRDLMRHALNCVKAAWTQGADLKLALDAVNLAIGSKLTL